ncbi:hypothetical protein BOX15_Mlig011824g3 [Macrostomum lignano]|uniref:FAD dependent oxidoreductase domain-containing protein n=1 Tax=Macrostomum lignano TaxID=282301 RepID=A0A267DBS8_9PLAT|nr:hypothetical protein BOX15_Mlig011824g2 [Macrostomum lignano]PAA77849.1 hypothetical protein BOX15_Mlig011824g3 [Macrostomum lignano]
MLRAICSRRLPPAARRWSAVTSQARFVGSRPAEPSLSVIDSAQVVVCGAGVTGCSIAYHLTELGCKSVLLLEQGASVGCGTTWHSVGLISQLRQFEALTQLAKQTVQTCKQLDDKGFPSGFVNYGSLSLAESSATMHSLERLKAMGDAHKIESHLLGPSEIQRLVPSSLMLTDDLIGALYTPSDGALSSPMDLTNAYLSAAKAKGAEIRLGTHVRRVHLNMDGRVASVETPKGLIECEAFVNAAGQWARQLGRRCTERVRIPLGSCEHFAMFTQPAEDDSITKAFPVVRNNERLFYVREWQGGLCVGGFEPTGKVVFPTGVPPNFENQLLPEDNKQFEPIVRGANHRFPMLSKLGVRSSINGPETFTPDAQPIFGEVPDIPGYFVAAGLNSVGISLSGGLGASMAELVMNGKTQVDTTSIDVRRFVPQHTDHPAFIVNRLPESYNALINPGPKNQFNTGRQLIVSALHEAQREHGAVLEQTQNGYEHPVFYDHPQSQNQMQASWRSYGRPFWIDFASAEYRKIQRMKTIYDNSSATQIRITAHTPDDLEAFLSSVFNRTRFESGLSRLPSGDFVTMSSRDGQSLELFGRLVKQTERSAIFLSSGVAQTRAVSLLNEKAADETVAITDISINYCLLHLPRAVHYGEFPRLPSDPFTFADETDVFVLAQAGNAPSVFRYLNHAQGFVPIGYYAMRMFRLSERRPEFAEDFHCRLSPRQLANLGKFALPSLNPASDYWIWGGEPLFRNGEAVGTVLCSSYDPSRDKIIGYFAPPEGAALDGIAVRAGSQEHPLQLL